MVHFAAQAQLGGGLSHHMCPDVEQLVVPRRSLVSKIQLNHRQEHASLFQLRVHPTRITQHLHTRGFQIGRVRSVVNHVHAIGVGIPYTQLMNVPHSFRKLLESSHDAKMRRHGIMRSKIHLDGHISRDEFAKALTMNVCT